MEYNYIVIVVVLVSSFIGHTRGSVCISNCPPNCDGTIPNGRHTGCLGGQMCSYECDQGYEKMTAMLTCQDGVLKPLDIELWGSDEPLCRPKPCPGMIPNGALSDTCIAKVGFSCEYTCNDGYSKLSDITTIRCDSTTSWSPNPHSLCTNYNQCPYEIPGTDLDLSCRRHPGEQCTYTCRKGYVHSHYAMADCRSTLDWMQRIDAICIEIKCPAWIEYGSIEYPCTRKYGEICHSYKCYAPYVKPSVPPSLKCNASDTLDYRDTTGYWEWDKDSIGQPCVREEDFCPSTFSNGKVFSNCHLQPGAECSYTCDAGCDNNPSVSMVHCRQSGGRWEESTSNLCTNCKRCPDSIANGRLVSLLCERRPSTTCSFTCNYGCRKAVTTLSCNNNGEWSSLSPCICSEQGTTSDIEDTKSSSSVIIGGVVVMVVFVFLLLCVACLFRYRWQRNRQSTSARENGVQMIAPSAPPLDGNSSTPNYGPSPYSQIQTTPAYNDSYSRQIPSGYSDFHADNRSGQRFSELRAKQTPDPTDNMHGTQRVSEYSRSDTTDPPPSYEQVTADPSRFKT